MKEIADFFALPEAEQTYEMAVSLYARFGSNRMLGSHFAMRQNKYNMEKVRYELRRITGITGAQLVKEEKQKKQAPPPPKPPDRLPTYLAAPFLGRLFCCYIPTNSNKKI